MTADISGLRQRILFAPETTWGTESTGTYMVAGQIQSDVSVSGGNNLIEIHKAGLVNTREVLETTFAPQISNLDFYVQDGSFIAASIGGFDTTSPVTNGGNYKHIATTEDSTSTIVTPVEYEVKPYTMSLGLELGTTDDVITMTGCYTDSLTIGLTLNEPLKVSGVSIMGKTISVGTTAKAMNFNKMGPWMYHNASTLTLDGGTTVNVTDMSITVSNNLKTNHGVGSRIPTSVLQGQRSIKANIKLNYQDATFLKKFLSSAANPTSPSSSGVKEFTIAAVLDNGVTPSTGATYRGVAFTLSGCKFDDWERSFPMDGSVVQETYNIVAKKLTFEWWDDSATDPW